MSGIGENVIIGVGSSFLRTYNYVSGRFPPDAQLLAETSLEVVEGSLKVIDENFNFKTFIVISVMSCFVIVIYWSMEVMMGSAVCFKFRNLRQIFSS